MFLHFQRLLEDATGERITAAMTIASAIQRTLVDKLGYPALTTEDFYEAYAEFLTEELKGMTVAQLEEKFADDFFDRQMIYFARLVASCAIQSNPDKFGAFAIAVGSADVSSFCRQHVEPVNIEADQMQIIGLVDGFQRGVEVVYLDGSGGDLNSHKFSPEGSDSPASRPHLILLPTPPSSLCSIVPDTMTVFIIERVKVIHFESCMHACVRGVNSSISHALFNIRCLISSQCRRGGAEERQKESQAASQPASQVESQLGRKPGRHDDSRI